MLFLSSNPPVSQNWGAGQANFGIAKILTAPILEVHSLGKKYLRMQPALCYLLHTFATFWAQIGRGPFYKEMLKD